MNITKKQRWAKRPVTDWRRNKLDDRLQKSGMPLVLPDKPKRKSSEDHIVSKFEKLSVFKLASKLPTLTKQLTLLRQDYRAWAGEQRRSEPDAPVGFDLWPLNRTYRTILKALRRVRKIHPSRVEGTTDAKPTL